MNISPTSIKLPSWLNWKSTSRAKYFDDLLSTLENRERERHRARKTSRMQKIALVSDLPMPIAPPPNELSKQYSITIGCSNHWGNRYSDIEPYDRTRVIVGSALDGDNRMKNEARYFNGSWVRELFGGQWWIATQAPVPAAAHTFLSIMLQPLSPPQLDASSSPSAPSRVRTVVQLTRNVEGGRRKADDYFPSQPGQSSIINPELGSNVPSLKVTLLESRYLKESRSTQSKVSVLPILQSNQNHIQPVIFTHMMYSIWPDGGVPEEEDKESLIAFLRLVDETNKNTSEALGPAADIDPPIMVHCSAGVGRTGSFIAMSSLFRAYNLFSATPSASGPKQLIKCPFSLPRSPLGPLPKQFEDDLVVQEVDSLREQRPSMVQRDEQVILIYELLLQAFSKGS